MRRSLKFSLSAVGVVALSAAVMTGSASAKSAYTSFGSGTGIQQVSYSSGSSYMSRSGSGIVQQWVAPNTYGTGAFGGYFLFKPLSGDVGTEPNEISVITPFAKSCDSQGLVGTYFPREWVFATSNYDTDLSAYFPFDGLTYWVCQYDLYDHAEGDVTYHAAGATPDRHAVYSVHEASPFGPAGGTFTYSDSNLVTYTVSVDAVYIDGNTVIFSGQIDDGDVNTVGPWLIVKAVDTGTGIEQYGDVVAFDPAASLTTHLFSIQAFDTAGTLTIYTR